jgi:hypothetical protein
MAAVGEKNMSTADVFVVIGAVACAFAAVASIIVPMRFRREGKALRKVIWDDYSSSENMEERLR